MNQQAVGWEPPSPERISTRADFTRELRLLREQSGLSVRDLSGRLGRHRTHGTIAGWLAGRNIPSVASLDLFVGLLRACGVTDEQRVDAWLAAWRLVNRTQGR